MAAIYSGGEGILQVGEPIMIEGAGQGSVRVGRPHGGTGRRRTWLARLVLATAVPLLFFVSSEGALRLLGVGHPSRFFLRLDDAHVSNQQFGWRFFPPQLARDPLAVVVPDDPGPDTLRVFVLGGSAAMGIPDPAFSLGRMLEIMLQDAYPDRHVEVYNLAMTAVNSHVVRVITRECTRLRPDLLVGYLGNNEVVGPYGAGTVFPGRGGSLGLVRLSISVRGLRLAQLVEAVLPRRRDGSGTWHGMEMFVGQRVAADDPRLETTAEWLRRNLLDMGDAAMTAGAPLLLSTVAVNLADCPPFASLHTPGLPDGLRRQVDALLGEGDADAAAGDHASALAAYRRALEVDDRFADIHFRLGRSLLALDRLEEARRHLSLARDLDALRFRADSSVNEVIRKVAAAHPAVHLVDGAAALAGAPESPLGIPGGGLFWEHVHLRVVGNYRLARAVLDSARALLGGAREAVPSFAGCADRLALTPWDEHRMAADILSMTSRPPFVGQLDHEARREALRGHVHRLARAATASLQASEDRLRRAVEAEPHDLVLRTRLAELLEQRGRHAEAIEQWRTLLGRLPDQVPWLTQLAMSTLGAGDPQGAAALMERVVELRPTFPQAHLNLGLVRERAHDASAARASYERALELDPWFVPARLNLGSLLASEGRLGDAAGQYRRVLELEPESAEALFGLATVLERQGHLEEAAASYRGALAADPDLVKAGNNLGLLLESLGRPDQAEQVLKGTIETDPSYAMAHFNLADLLLAAGRSEEAAERYRAALELAPDNLQGRVNRALALQTTGDHDAAAAELREVLRRSPGSVETRLRLAWLLAVSPEPGVTDPTEAMRLAAEAAQLTRHRVPEVLEEQAKVLAAVGRTGDARQVLARALEQARSLGNAELASRIDDELRRLQSP